jgi:uncharacterized delta-60 repeat protein
MDTDGVLVGGTGGTKSVNRRRWVVRAAVGLCALAAGLGLGIAMAGSGGLDSTFGTSGTTVLEHPTSTYPTPTGLAPAGKIVTVSTSNGVITVSRLLPNGAPDPAFDGDGQAVIEEPGFPSADAVVVQPDGKIVLVGFKNVGSSEEDAMVWRLKADGGSGAVNGALDSTFGTGGEVALKPHTDNVARAVAIQPDGRILVAGTVFDMPAGKNMVAVWRLTETGALDTSFDTDGTAGISDTHEDFANAIAIAPGGKIVVAGSTDNASNPPDAVVWRLTPNGGPGALNGALDTTFDTDGQADVDSGGKDTAQAVAVQPDGKIILAGRSEFPGHTHAMVWRLKVDGGSGLTNDGLDPSFDTDGAAVIEAGSFASASAVALQPDGKILLAGYGEGGAVGAAIVWRLAANGGGGDVNGALDPGFGTGGAASVTAGAGASASAIALEPDRRIVAAGSTFSEHLLVFRTLGDPFTATVTKAGTGTGSVQSSPAGIDCGGACSAPFDDGSALTLTATPAAGSAFAGWSGGGCSGAGSCALTMSSDQAVTASFKALPPAVTSATKPALSALRESNSTFTVGPTSTALSGHASARRHPRGTVFSFKLDQAATVKIVIRARRRGRRVAHSCRAATHRLRHRPACTRTVILGTLSRTAHAGLDTVSFSGRFPGRKLAPGRYQAVFTAADGAGIAPAQTLSFTIVKR